MAESRTCGDGSGAALPVVVTFVGDSITKQLYFATRCEAERAGNFSAQVSFDLLDSRWLWSVPCPADCAAAGGDARAACDDGCASDGGAAARANNEGCVARVPPATRVLVLGTGLWYNPAKGVADGDAAYAATLQALAPVLRGFLARGVRVLWLDIPPCVKHCTHEPYHRDGEAGKNAAAAAALAAHVPGAVFLNTSAATAFRKLHQPSATSDGVHWCSPGRDTVTAFLATQLLHLAAEAPAACASESSHEHRQRAAA
jgi:hypothetical protein